MVVRPRWWCSPNPGPPEEVIVIVALAVIAATVVILLPLAKAWARRLSGADTGRLEELEQRVVDLEALDSGGLSTMQEELGGPPRTPRFCRAVARAGPDIQGLAPGADR